MALCPKLPSFISIVSILIGLASPVEAKQPGCPRAQLPAYAHNDYLNTRPLQDALELGYRGVEVDVFLVGGVLRLGHDRKSAERSSLLETAYLAPLAKVIESCPNLPDDGVPFLLNIEIKSPSRPAFDSLAAIIDRYPGLREQERISVVMVGWYPSIEELKRTRLKAHSVVGRVSPRGLDEVLGLASVDYGKTIGRWWNSSGVKRQWMERISAQKRRVPNIPVRAHNVPVDREVYRRLLSAGVDLIGTRNLRASRSLLDGL